MQVEQKTWTHQRSWTREAPSELGDAAQLVLVFGATALLERPELARQIEQDYPGAHLLGCSTSGEICSTRVGDDTLVVTAIRFEHTRIEGARVGLTGADDSFEAGARLAAELARDGLVHLFVLSDGLRVNGSDLVRGLAAELPPRVTVTGGLAGDADRFEKTLVLWDGPAEPNSVAAVGLYGDRVKVGFGSLGGWDPFGPERLITKSKGNVLFELDGRSALQLYKLYLGEHAKGLPATGLLFPLSLRTGSGETGVVRTILSVDEERQSMTFAGDVPEGAYARLMKANFDRLIDGAIGAAETSHQAIGGSQAELAILISCIGRKLVLRQRVEEEVEGVREALGSRPSLTGFYSYGEISPFTPGVKCELHNQTMTITTLLEE